MPQHPDQPSTSAPRPLKARWLAALYFFAAIALPPALYYVLRAFGLSIYLSLVIVAITTGVPALVSLFRRRAGASIITTYFSLVSLAATLLAFIPGSPQFLMARDAAITAGTGAWFIYSIRAERPFVYTLTRPLVEGRMTWPVDWENTGTPPHDFGVYGEYEHSCGGLGSLLMRECEFSLPTP